MRHYTRSSLSQRLLNGATVDFLRHNDPQLMKNVMAEDSGIYGAH